MSDAAAMRSDVDDRRGILRWFWQLRPRARAMMLLATLVIALNVTTALSVTKVSQIDERYYIDDLIKASRLELNQSGDFLDDETLIELCERGHQAPKLHFPPCRPGRQDPKDFVPGGVNYLESLPPYFFVTGPVARALRALPLDLGPRDSLVTWARLLGAAWLLLGCYCTLRAAELLGIRRRLAMLGLVLVIGTPTVLHAGTIVNPDATAFAAGAAVLWAVLAWERRHCPFWVPVLVALVATAMKLPNTVGIAIVCAYLVARAIQRRWGDDDGELRPLSDVIKMLIGLLVTVVVAVKGLDAIWDQLRHHVLGAADTNPYANEAVLAQINTYRVDSLSGSRVFGADTVFAIFPPIQDIALPQQRQASGYDTLWRAASYLLLAPLVVIPLAARTLSRRVVQLALATLVAVVTVPSLFVLYWYLSSNTTDQIVWRYGLSALPAFVLVLAAVAARGRLGIWIVGVNAALLYIAAMVTNF